MRTERNPEKSFRELLFNSRVCDLLMEKSIVKPTPIQLAVIPLIGSFKDVVVRAGMGSGKTLAYLIALIDLVLGDFERYHYVSVPTVIIIVPTYESAQKVFEELMRMIKERYIKRRTDGPVICALKSPILPHESLEDLMEYVPDVVVSTVDSVLSCFKQGFFEAGCPVTSPRYLVIDQIDEVLLNGFEDLTSLMGHVPESCLRFVFSDNPSFDVDKIKPLIPRPPYIITMPEAGEERVEISPFVEQYYISCDEKLRLHHILSLIYTRGREKIVIFTHSAASSHLLRYVLDKGKRTNWRKWKIAVVDFKSPLGECCRWRIQQFNEGAIDILIVDESSGIVQPGCELFHRMKLHSLDIVVHYDMPPTSKEYRNRLNMIEGTKIFVSYTVICNLEQKGVLQSTKPYCGENFIEYTVHESAVEYFDELIKLMVLAEMDGDEAR